MRPYPGDVYALQGEWEELHSNHNFNAFCFDDYMKRRGVSFSMQVEKAERVQEASGPRAALYRHVHTLPQNLRTLALSLLYGIQEEGSYFIRACGLHLSTLAYVVQRLLRRKWDVWQANAAGSLLLLVLGALSVFHDSLFRVLCFRLAALFGEDRKDVCGLGMLLVLFSRPYLAQEMTFVLPVLLRLAFLFNRSRLHRLWLVLLVLIPVQLCYFHEVSILQTLLFQPLRYAYLLLYLLVVLTLFFPFSASMALWLSEVLEQGIGWVQQVSLSYAPSLLWLLLWGVLALSLLSRKKSYKLVLGIALLAYSQAEAYFDPFFEVMIIDVGQGDCALITLPYHQQVILIDVAGSLYRNIPETILLPILRDKKIDHIDTLIITHDDYDHSGGLKELQELIPISHIITQKQDVKGAISLYAPLADYTGVDKNDDSVITWFEWDGLSYLFMGDAGIAAEEELLKQYQELPCTFLKLGHHGSKTSSSQAFLHALHPALALISVGYDNRYGHPSEEVLNHLEQEGISYLSTAQHGAIAIRTTRWFKYIKTARGDFAIIKTGDTT